jgi:hypothetical protein
MIWPFWSEFGVINSRVHGHVEENLLIQAGSTKGKGHWNLFVVLQPIPTFARLEKTERVVSSEFLHENQSSLTCPSFLILDKCS